MSNIQTKGAGLCQLPPLAREYVVLFVVDPALFDDLIGQLVQLTHKPADVFYGGTGVQPVAVQPASVVHLQNEGIIALQDGDVAGQVNDLSLSVFVTLQFLTKHCNVPQTFIISFPSEQLHYTTEGVFCQYLFVLRVCKLRTGTRIEIGCLTSK